MFQNAQWPPRRKARSSTRHTSAAAAAKLVERWCVQILGFLCFLLLYECFQVAENDFMRVENGLLRARIAELENVSDADEEPMQIAAINDVDLLKAFSPVTAAVSTAASAAASTAAVSKKVSIDYYESFSV